MSASSPPDSSAVAALVAQVADDFFGHGFLPVWRSGYSSGRTKGGSGKQRSRPLYLVPFS